MANQQSKTNTQSSTMNNQKQQPISDTAQKGTADNMKQDSSFNQNSNLASESGGRQQTTR
jgi:hypothetical protein